MGRFYWGKGKRPAAGVSGWPDRGLDPGYEFQRLGQTQSEFRLDWAVRSTVLLRSFRLLPPQRIIDPEFCWAMVSHPRRTQSLHRPAGHRNSWGRSIAPGQALTMHQKSLSPCLLGKVPG